MSDSKQNDAALDGIEDINGLVARYTALERFYLDRDDLTLQFEFQESLIALYSKVLEFQATAACFFGRNTFVRTIRSTLQLEDWTKLLKDVKIRDVACKEITQIFDVRDQRSDALLLKQSLENQASKMNCLVQQLHLDQHDNLKTLLWFSDVQYDTPSLHVFRRARLIDAKR